MSIRDRVLNWRNNLLSDPGFQDWAATFPLTRFVARHRAREVFDLTAGFVYSQILFACVELDVFHALRAGPLSVDALSQKTGLPIDGTLRLARAATALKLLQSYSGERFGLGERGAALLGNPSVFEMIRHHSLLYNDLGDPVALLRARSTKTDLAKFWNYTGDVTGEIADSDREDAHQYSDLMAETQAFIASEVLHAYSFSGHKHLMDVGGGAGAFLCAVAKQAPGLKLTLCDLPAVADIAGKRFAQEGLTSRAGAIACNFLKDPLPTGADVITLVRVLHDHDDDKVETLLSATRKALPPDGALVIAEPMAQTAGAEPMGDAYFGLYLWAMGSGRPRSHKEITHLLKAAGFGRVRTARARRPILTQVLVAQ